jgi:acetyl esterase
VDGPLTLRQELKAAALARVGAGLLGMPRPLLCRLAGEPPPAARGLDPEAWLFSRLTAAVAKPAGEVPIDVGRRLFEVQVKPLAARPPLPVAAADLLLPGPDGSSLHARLYTPHEAPDVGPLLLYLHGGGWVRGSVASHDGSCRLLAQLAGVRVLSLKYRLAPEHPFPAGFEDALAAYEHVATEPARFGADPARLAVGGDSAGGNLAAALTLDLRGGSLPEPVFQLLIYPVCDLVERHRSEDLYRDGYYLTTATMDWFCDQYVPEVERRSDPRVSPLLADDLSGLPPAHVATALADPLRDEGEAYARALAAAGVPTTLQRHPLVHGFFTLSATRSGRQAVAQVAGVLRQALTPLR